MTFPKKQYCNVQAVVARRTKILPPYHNLEGPISFAIAKRKILNVNNEKIFHGANAIIQDRHT